MELMDLRVIITVVSFVVFLLIVVWACSGRQKARFDEAALLPFADEDMQRRTVNRPGPDDEQAPARGQTTGQAAVRATARQEVPHG